MIDLPFDPAAEKQTIPPSLGFRQGVLMAQAEAVRDELMVDGRELMDFLFAD